jgi:hypothetical protein
MYGSTNAKIITGSAGGGGDVVYAINNTSSTITEGQKIWLNKHNLDENVAYKKFERGNGYNIPHIYFDADNNVLFKFNNYKSKLSYNTDTKTWSEYALSSGIDTRFMRVINDEWICFTNNVVLNDSGEFSYIVDATKESAIKGGQYLGNNYLLKYVSSGNYALQEINTSTGEVLKTLYTFTNGKDGIVGAFLKNNKLFYATGSYSGIERYFIYDVTALFIDNPGFTAEPQLLNAVTLPSSTSYIPTWPIMFATGADKGNYIIGHQGGSQNEIGGKPLVIYKIDDDYNLVEATDLPDTIASQIGQTCFVQYYDDTDILVLGTLDNIHMFKYSNGSFTDLNLTITLPTDWTKLATYPWKMWISKDMTSAVVMSNEGFYSQQQSLYKLKTSSDAWYADVYGMTSEQTITGVATGVINEEGLFEINTVL